MKLTPSNLTTTLALPEAHDLATAVDESQLLQLRDAIADTIKSGEVPMRLIREMCGPEASGMPGQLLGQFNLGLAQFRAAEATLATAFRALNVRRREQEPELPMGAPQCRKGGTIHMSHDFDPFTWQCNTCGWVCEKPSIR